MGAGRAGAWANHPKEHNARRARTLVQEQQFSRASQALTSAGLAKADKDTIKLMRKKHPNQERPQLTEGPAVLSASEVFQAVKHFKAGSAPGPSGLRAEHLKEAVGRSQGNGLACLASLTGVLNKMSAGLMPEEVAPYYCGANLFAALKKQGGIRPVAVGEVLRRLCSKALATKVAPTLLLTFHHSSLGWGSGVAVRR